MAADMADGWAIRPPAPGDAPQLLELMLAHARRQDMPDDILTLEKLTAALFSQPPLISCLLAQDGGDLIGYALHHPCWDAPFAARGVTMTELYVSPRHRRRGVGRGLIQHLEKSAKDSGGTFMHWAVAPENTDALEFYGAIGAKRRLILSHVLTF